MRVDDAVVLVTGASGGIGAACARLLDARGARVVLHGRHPDSTQTECGALAAKTVSADFTDARAVDELAAEAHDVYGRVDAVVHCAGVGWYGQTAAMGPDRLDEVLQVNLHAPLRLTRAVLPEMVERRSGHVAFVASIAGLTGVARESVYSAAKSGLITFADALRGELAASGVEVSVVSPGAVRTRFFERRGEPYERRLPRLLSAERVARAVVDGIEHHRANQVVPRWLGVAPAVRSVAPPVFRALNQRWG